MRRRIPPDLALLLVLLTATLIAGLVVLAIILPEILR
jgi:hypothetical protein